MCFDFKCFIDLAEEIVNNYDQFDSNNRAYFRTAVSRAYYGIYHEACKVAANEGLKLSGEGSDHSKIKDYFFNKQVHIDAKRILGIKLSVLHKKRKKADYNKDKHFNDREAAISLKEAREALEYIRDIS